MKVNQRIRIQPAWCKSLGLWLGAAGTVGIVACGLCLRPVTVSHRAELGSLSLVTAAASGGAGTSVQDSSAPAGAAGYRVYRDPFTRKFAPPPENMAVLQPTGALAVAFSTSGEGLQAVRSILPNGGIVLNLRGRFQNGLVAALNSSGDVTAHCVGEAAGLPEAADLCH